MVIPAVIATTFMNVNSSGRTRPCTFSCVNSNNESHDYFVKFHGAIDSYIMFEFVAALLGQSLGINIPDISIVQIDQRMVQVINDEEARKNFLAKPGPHFGSKSVGNGYEVMNSGYNLASESLTQAIDIFAFDMLIQNADRRKVGEAGKPNILFKGNELVAIDHEMAFSFVNSLGKSPEPWHILETGLPLKHVFYPQLKKHTNNQLITFANFIEKLLGIKHEYMENVMQAIPSEWYNERYGVKIINHIQQVQSNADKFHQGLLEVFA